MIIIYFFRTLIYYIFFFFNAMELKFFIIWKKIFPKYAGFSAVAKKWCWRNVIGLKYICGVDYRIIGLENMPKANFLAVSKHQSAWECYFLYYLLPDYPVCVSKKELMKAPVMGKAMDRVGSISIDRGDGMGSIKNIVSQSKKYVEEGRSVFLIFPQGTRVPPDSTADAYPYKPGFIAIAKVNNLDMVPISLNSGICCPKGKFIRKPGLITVKIMPPIKYEDYKDLDKDVLLKNIENTIEENQKLL